MLERSYSTNFSAASIAAPKAALDEEVEALHRRCGIYTKPQVIRRILDAVGWRADVDLSRSRLLEPAAGDGAFVVEAARRLVAAYSRYGVELRAHALSDRIQAFELHPREAERARSRVAETLRELGVHHLTAKACAQSWVVNADFLLADLPSDGFTHAVGNPPYVRWSKIPPNLKARYACRLPSDMVGGDLFLPFLDRALGNLEPLGKCGFLCSDRWRFMQFAEAFREKWLPRLDIVSEELFSAREAFVKPVDSYPRVLIASTKPVNEVKALTQIIGPGTTLSERGYVVKVGPALGHSPAFVLESDEHDVEAELLRPWIDGSEIKEGAVVSRGRRVIVMHGEDGLLIEPKLFPLLMARLTRFADKLKLRSIVLRGSPWFRPIDRVSAAHWVRPKLLIPELAKVPRVAIDRTGAIPSHGVYAIFAPGDDVEALYEKLSNGKLAKALDGNAPRVKGGYIRCYRRFLTMVRIED
jgi:adenine-specific DNA-methyltransferase